MISYGRRGDTNQRTLTSRLAGSQPAGFRRKPCRMVCRMMTDATSPARPRRLVPDYQHGGIYNPIEGASTK